MKQRQKLIRIADESDLGWKVVDEYVQSEVASDEEDQKRINRAQAMAGRKAKADKGRKKTRWSPMGGSRFPFPAPTATVTSQTQQQQQQHPQQGRLGTCFNCGQGGHWKFECPNAKKNVKLSTFDNSDLVLCSKGMEAVKDTEVSLVQQNNGEGVGAANTGKCLGQSTTSEICDNGSVSSVDSSSKSPYNRLKKNISCWKKAGADQYILSVIDNGYKIPFKETPDSFHAKNNKSARDNPDFVTKEIKNLVSKQCVSEVTEKPHIVNPLTVAYNKKGKPRLVLDCRYVNEKLHLFKFKYEDMQIARSMFEKGTYMYGLDIRGAYNHIDRFSEHRTFLGFAWQYDGKEHFYVYNSLPFGLASAGHIFTKVLRVMTSYLRSKGHNVITFLDDGLGGSTSFTKALISSEFVHQTFLELGVLLSDEKCQWKPTLTITWLGYFLNMESGKFFIADGRIERIQESLQSMISQLQSQDLSIVPARFAASVVGQIISTQLVLGKIVRLKTRELYKCINSRLTWESYIFMSEKAVQELVFWLQNIQALNEKTSLKVSRQK